MASNERQFKAEFVQAARGQGAHVVVVSGSYLAGIPDLYVKYKEHAGFWLELKYQEGPKKSYPVALTALQRAFLLRHHCAAGWAGWLLCVRCPDAWRVYGSAVILPHRVAHDGPWLLATRRRGEEWDPSAMLWKLTQGD